MPSSNEDKRKFVTPIPYYQINRLKFMLENTETEVVIVINLHAGDKVYVTSGALKGLEGLVSEADEHSVVGVLIAGLGYACVRISKSRLSYSFI